MIVPRRESNRKAIKSSNEHNILEEIIRVEQKLHDVKRNHPIQRNFGKEHDMANGPKDWKKK